MDLGLTNATAAVVGKTTGGCESHTAATADDYRCCVPQPQIHDRPAGCWCAAFARKAYYMTYSR